MHEELWSFARSSLWCQHWLTVLPPSPAPHFLSHTTTQSCFCFASTIRRAAGNTSNHSCQRLHLRKPQTPQKKQKTASEDVLSKLLSHSGTISSLRRNENLCKEGSQNCTQVPRPIPHFVGVSPLPVFFLLFGRFVKAERKRKKHQRLM